MAAFNWRVTGAVDVSIGSSLGPDDQLVGIRAMFTSNSGGTGAQWEEVDYSGSSPKYLLLQRKTAAAGRIIFFGQNGGTPNAAAVTGTPLASTLYVAYSATSTASSPDASWLSGAPLSASDYMPGVVAMPATNPITVRMQYAEFADGVVVLASYSASGVAIAGAGKLLFGVDGNPVDAIMGSGTSWSAAFLSSSAATGSLINPSISNSTYTSTNAGLIARLSGVNRQCYRLFSAAANAASQLENTATSFIYHYPIAICGNTTDIVNIVGRMRQMAFGPTANRETIRYVATEPFSYGLGYQTSGATAPMLWLVNAEI